MLERVVSLVMLISRYMLGPRWNLKVRGPPSSCRTVRDKRNLGILNNSKLPEITFVPCLVHNMTVALPPTNACPDLWPRQDLRVSRGFLPICLVCLRYAQLISSSYALCGLESPILEPSPKEPVAKGSWKDSKVSAF